MIHQPKIRLHNPDVRSQSVWVLGWRGLKGCFFPHCAALSPHNIRRRKKKALLWQRQWFYPFFLLLYRHAQKLWQKNLVQGFLSEPCLQMRWGKSHWTGQRSSGFSYHFDETWVHQVFFGYVILLLYLFNHRAKFASFINTSQYQNTQPTELLCVFVRSNCFFVVLTTIINFPS